MTDLDATLVHVRGIIHGPAVPRLRGYTPILVLARHRLGPRSWALLAAWQGHWQQQGHTIGAARWGWLRYDVPEPGALDPVQPMPPPPASALVEGDEWYGQHELSQFAVAVRQAAQSLPVGLRAAALTPRPVDPA